MRLGRSPSLLAALLTASQQIFQRVCVRQNAQGKGRAEGSKKVAKGRGALATPARVTTPRNAGYFKGFDVLKRGDQRWSVGIASNVIRWPDYTSNSNGTYVVFPWNIREVFGKGRVKVHAEFDGVPYDGSIVNMGLKDARGEICYMIGVLKFI